MQIKSINDNQLINFTEDAIIKIIEKNRDIDDFENFIAFNTNRYIDPSKLSNIDYGAKLLKESIDNNDKIKVIVDSDVDGYTSSALFINYIDELTNKKLDIEFFIHEDKSHGVKDSFIEDDIDLVVVPDAGMNSLDEIIKIRDRGKKVIVLDHHPIPENMKKEDYFDIENVAFINDKISDEYPNKELSGVGITFKFCHYFNNKFHKEYKKVDLSNYFDLVALGMTADYMNMKELENRLMCKLGFKIKSNQFINALIEKRSYNVGHELNYTKISMVIAPMINATIRVGTQEEKTNTFKAFLDRYAHETLEYKPRGKDYTIDVPIYEDMARQCTNIKARQDRARKKIAEELSETIEDDEIYKNKVMCVPFIEDKSNGLIGLTAMEIASMYNKPTLVVKPNPKTGRFEGSGRNFNNSPLPSLKNFLQGIGMFDYVEGHDNAFGVGFDMNDLDEIMERINNELDDFITKDEDEIIHVDFLLDCKYNDIEDIINVVDIVTEYDDEWSNGFERPSMGIINFNINPNNVKVMGKNEDTIKIVLSPVLEMMFFKLTEEEINSIIYGGDIDIVCKMDINSWKLEKGHSTEVTRQLIVENYQLKNTLF